MGQACWGKPIGTRFYFIMQQKNGAGPVYSFNKKGVKKWGCCCPGKRLFPDG